MSKILYKYLQLGLFIIFATMAFTMRLCRITARRPTSFSMQLAAEGLNLVVSLPSPSLIRPFREYDTFHGLQRTDMVYLGCVNRR